ncbi:Aste57867_17488 [Aphanomyces stellatus]|uniref:Aste57867_17488 protein n=1 Tax=Aphanomyces stellatus TaxID=120398 RepID=A0A485L8M7_9STRA|nr:hypothetical protein As57867_017428 [Aphanomyces stellatus]VFT94241.1 Aste57867_17488 [Aphanomyces stellatus]
MHTNDDYKQVLESKLARWEALERQDSVVDDAVMISLDVGGIAFQASRHHLVRFKDSYFAALLGAGHWQPDGPNESFSLDLDPTHFWRVLRFLRTGELTFEGLDTSEAQDFRATLDYLNVEVPQDVFATSFEVMHAGFLPVNGVYDVEEGTIHDGCAVYNMTSPVDGVMYSIFRVEMPSKKRRWYISYSANRSMMGTSSDVDYYFCWASDTDYAPFCEGWRGWSKNPAAVGPAPTVSPIAWSMNIPVVKRPRHVQPGNDASTHGGTVDVLQRGVYKSYTVTGAGFLPVNGTYVMEEGTFHDDYPVFSMVSPYTGVTYTLSRVETSTMPHRWYLTYAVHDDSGHTTTDVGLYYGSWCDNRDGAPPEYGWQCTRNPDAVAPTPMVYPVTSNKVDTGTDVASHQDEPTSCTVAGAGFAPVNGTYGLDDEVLHDECPMYRMVSPMNGVTYTLFRVQTLIDCHRWYIGQIFFDQDSQATSTERLYFCWCSITENVPPQDGWRCIRNANAPAPIVFPIELEMDDFQQTET